ncbi:hypothetical protein JOB18_013500 [Solea senegalensis]|uniref:Uncharacterized protein n=1 Tax=Solea senegalensis TaxID=28829 RepID=A0AAV6QE35_SOLSE|nr:hypothetical protein JOB18_013500 [Solea senegalensis]
MERRCLTELGLSWCCRVKLPGEAERNGTGADRTQPQPNGPLYDELLTARQG